MQPSGVITITTDFGHKGPFTAVMKGVIIRRFPDAKIIDLIHDIPAQWPPEAGFWVSRAYKYFPEPVQHDRHYFMAPDNGLLSPILEDSENTQVFKLDLCCFKRLGLDEPSATFHGRDIFAPIAADIASGRTNPVSVGIPTYEWIPGWIDDPEVLAGKVSGVIVTVDTFGNLISNIDRKLIEGFRQPVVTVAGHEFAMAATYGRVQPGEYLALINSFGVIEVARAEGNAADGLGLERGAPIVISDGIET
jgi:S-adenosylmethionine hydrolase